MGGTTMPTFHFPFPLLALSKITEVQYITKIKKQPCFGVWWVRYEGWSSRINFSPPGPSHHHHHDPHPTMKITSRMKHLYLSYSAGLGL